MTTTRRPMPGPDREVVALTADLVRIDSSNPTLAPHGAGESTIADYCAAWLSTRGFTTVRLESTPGRPSILATGAGRGGGRSIMLNGHLDTVSLAGYDGDPLDPVIDDGRLHGRGSYDMKAGIAAMLVAAARAHHHPHRGDVVLALVADEEDASIGTEEVLTHLRAAGTEIDAADRRRADRVGPRRLPQGVRLGRRHPHRRRRPRLPPRSRRRRHHQGRRLPDRARPAGLRPRTRPGHPVLGAGSVHAGVIDGGQETSSYPDRCRITVERRTVPGEDTAVFEAELRAILDPIIAAQPGLGSTARRWAWNAVPSTATRPAESHPP